MITTAILTIFYNFVYFILSPIRALPDYVLPGGASAAISTAGGYLAGLDEILPVFTILAIVGLIFVVELAILTYKGIKWIYNKIPGVN